MSLTHPTALLWLLLAVPVVVFYILKIRLKRVPVSTVIFWRQIFDEKKPRSLWQKLRHLVSLLVQLLLLGLLVASLTEPVFSWEALNSRRVVLVFDTSASMTATDADPSRFAAAKAEAHDVIRGLRFRDEMAIVAAGSPPRVVCGLTGHAKTLRNALDGIPPTDGPTTLTEAVAIARRLTTEPGGGESRVVVVTDGCAADAVALSAAADVKVIGVGGKTANVGFTRFQVRRSTIDPIGYEILAEVTNQSDEPSGDFRVSISLNDRPIDVKPLNLAANGKWSEVIESTTADGGLLTAELVTKGDKADVPLADALLADNKAVAILPKREPIPVHLHTPAGNLFLQKVLEAHPLVRLTTSSKELPKGFPAEAVKVFLRDTPAVLPPGNVLVVDPANDCDLWAVGDKLQNPIVTRQDKDSPLMAHVRLDNVLMPEARKLTFSPAAGKPQVLAQGVSGDPLFALIDRPAGKVLVLSVNLDQGDLPFRTAFPILAMNALGVFAGGQGELRESLPTGATAEVTLPTVSATGPGYMLRSPDGPTRKLPAGTAKATVGPFDKVGVWEVVADAPNAAPVERYAVNLMSKAESDLRPPEGLTASPTATEAGLVGGWFGRPVWWYLAALAGVLAVAEWYLYQRRWIS
jgi:hypothetical protein